MSRKKARSLFQTQTFKTGLLSFLAGLAPILIRCAYEHRSLSMEDAIVIASLCSTLASVLIGRMETSPVYTPDGLPGANKSDFQ